MNAVRAASSHWPSDTLPFEWFGAVQSEAIGQSQARAFSVVLGSSGREFLIPADRTIVEVLRDAGVAVETAYEQGVCGTCVTSVVEGEPDHRDSVLSEEEGRGEGLMTICRSPAKSARLVLEL
jgi:vanillate O-demethylase ferredoxin subunit